MKNLWSMGIIFIAVALSSCGKESTWEKYEKWAYANVEFFNEKVAETDETGVPVYTKLIPDWNKGAFVLMKKYKEGDGGSPYLNSTVTVKYKGYDCDGNIFDSSESKKNGSVDFRVSELTDGWQIALLYMAVGDSCELVIPYQLGYGESGRTDSYGNYLIKPYSTLIFGVELTDIPKLEKP